MYGQLAGIDFLEKTDTSAMVAGAIISININYECDLDRNTKTCNPVYQLSRIDDASQVRGF